VDGEDLMKHDLIWSDQLNMGIYDLMEQMSIVLLIWTVKWKMDGGSSLQDRTVTDNALGAVTP
jgi:hypothetical protein